MAVTGTISRALSLAFAQLDKLLADPKANPEDVKKQAAKVQQISQQEAAAKNKRQK
jgi:hypothetical protein